MKKPVNISRRLVLKGFGGLGILLPALELTHGRLWNRAAAASPVAKRFLVFFEHGGTIANWDNDAVLFDGTDNHNVVDGWTPKCKPGDPLVLNDIHQPLVGFESDMLFVGGVDNLASKQQDMYDGGHGWANATALSHAKAVQGKDSSGNAVFYSQSPSIDAVLAGRMAKTNAVPFPSINLEVPAHNYGTPFWASANQETTSEGDPSAAFTKLFANVSSTGPTPAMKRAAAMKKSVLDGASAGLSLYKNKLSAQDQASIDAHLTLLRGIEQQLQFSAACTKPTVPAGPYNGYGADTPKIGPLQVDIMVAAMRCGLSNVGTINIGDFYNDWMMPPYPAAFNIGHSLDHSANDVGPMGPDAVHFNDWYKTIVENRQWRAQMFQRLLAGLKQTPEGGGTMLDNSLILWTSEFSYGGIHSVANLPIVLAGKAGGQLRTNRRVDFNGTVASGNGAGLRTTSATLGNLFTSILNLFGYPDTSFGDTWPDYQVYNGNRPYVGTKFVTGPLNLS
jgi:hypothetical protein